MFRIVAEKRIDMNGWMFDLQSKDRGFRFFIARGIKRSGEEVFINILIEYLNQAFKELGGKKSSLIKKRKNNGKH